MPRRTLPCSPCVEIGWRLAPSGAGPGERGRAAALHAGFERIGLTEIVSFTALANLRSRAVMERIGMRNANEDFEHPGSRRPSLRMHCLYRIDRAQLDTAMQNRSPPP